MVITGDSTDVTNEIQTNHQIAIETDGHPIQAKYLNNVTLESSDRSLCQDSAQYAASCPQWTGFCLGYWKNWMEINCKKTCGYCPGTYYIPT